MCHPATGADLAPPLWYAAQRVHELATFLSPHLLDRIRARDIELVSYSALAGSRRPPRQSSRRRLRTMKSWSAS
jgi:hypothetical protein